MRQHIDLNCDLGEGCGNDAAIMPWISSANIACGGHAGDDASMRETLRLCRQFGIRAGAHPGHADPGHFGRRELDLPHAEVARSLEAQLQRLAAVAREEAVDLIHVKPHGALYNQAARDRGLAETIANAVARFDARLILVGLAGSELPRAGERAGLQVAHEAFADRRYMGNGQLVARGTEGALITDLAAAVEQAVSIVRQGTVTTLAGEALRLRADTICLHGDGAHAIEFAKALHEALVAAGIAIA
jgi:5-oxoprolinase (ATP-hydrolysing) subunit A